MKAKRTGRGIAIEELTGIRAVGRFADLGAKLIYKARRYGVPLVMVDPRNTSKMCSVCGCVDKANRPNQSTFLCVSCGFSAHADVNGAVNIGVRGTASVNAPYMVRDLDLSPRL